MKPRDKKHDCILLKKLWNDWYCTETAIIFESHKFPFTDLLF